MARLNMNLKLARAGAVAASALLAADRAAVERCDNAAPLDRVHAIQIVHERVRDSDSSYTSYEINLVLHDAQRVTVVDHGSLKHIRRDAEQIAELIGVPVWDATA